MKPHVPPPEVLAREAYLKRCLDHAESAAPSKMDPALQRLEGVDPGSLLPELEAKGLVEEAADLLRSRRGKVPPALEAAASAARVRRAARWGQDSERLKVRLRFSKHGEAAQLGAPELQRLFGSVMRLEGLAPCLDLGRRPHGLLAVAPPLPPGVEGDAEWAEAELPRSPRGDAADRLAALNLRLPPGLRLGAWEEAPTFATPISDLCERAHWRWPCPEPHLAEARGHVAAFMASEQFERAKVGKVEGQKQEKRVDLRAVVLSMDWEGAELRFTTQLGEHAALNPLKLLGSLLGLAPEAIHGLRRLGFDLAPDPRLEKADRYQTKLKNIYEDAVLLGAASNITIVDEDDDEPIHLG